MGRIKKLISKADHAILVGVSKIILILEKKYGKSIEVLNVVEHRKASEKYVDVKFHYQKSHWDGYVPVEYPRGGLHPKSDEEVAKIIEYAYKCQDPSMESEWKKASGKVWKGSNSDVTLKIFNGLSDSKWKCSTHLASTNNPARRIQDLKDKGFIIGTDTKRFCKKCRKKTIHHIMLRIPPGASRKYETWSPALRGRIVKVLESFDAYENRKGGADLLPDHKFPEARWDEKTHEKNPDNMRREKIIKKFQLLNNKRNEQKREACRCCLQSGIRGKPYGIGYFYKGTEKWPKRIPDRGKKAEQGCVGCGWYDLTLWRKKLNEKLREV